MTPTFGRIKRLTAACFAASCLALAACDGTVITCQTDCEEDTGEQLSNLVDTATAAGDFTTLMTALESAGLNSVLADDTQTFTVFAPTDAAFAALGDDAVTALLADSEALNDTLLYHVLPGSVNAATAIGLAGTTIAMQNNKAAAVSLDGDTLKINDANVTQTDIAASNGIIHVIDAVLTPPAETIPLNVFQTAAGEDNLNTLVAALQQSGLEQVLADGATEYTLFAPTDTAFEALGDDAVNALLADAEALNSTLLYHVLPGTVSSETAISLAGNSVTMQDGSSAALALDGDTLMINGANITRTDITATNGVVHIIDAVLTPPNTDTAPVLVDLTATLATMPNYSTLVANLQSTGLDAVLADSAKTHTLFAPNNAAFAAADADIQAAVAADASALEAVLLGHVLSDSIVPAATALTLNGTSITMANGANRTITVDGSMVSIDAANVVETDIEASNGVIHGIDAVLLDATTE
ncbi:MAG: fasciclin domain-containing protein [Pseudomonadota bacterium]